MENQRACTYKYPFSTWPASWQAQAPLPASCAQLPRGCAICKASKDASPRMTQQLERVEDRQGALLTHFQEDFFFVFSSLLSFDLSLAHSSTQGMLFNFLYVPFLQAYLNLRNWVFLTTSKSGLMTVKSSTAVALQVQDVLSQGLSGNNKSIYGRDMLQVTCTVNKCACCSQN